MARKPRIHFAGAHYHVMLRGNAGQNIFYSESDKSALSLLINEACCRYDCTIYAFCFMGNHIHLLVKVADIPLSKFVQNFAFRYAAKINKRERRSGHIFQGRYKAILVDEDSYLTSLVRYIHLNPVRAKLIDFPDAFWWSSHQDYLGDPQFPWVKCLDVLNMFHHDIEKAILAYREFIYDGLEGGDKENYASGGKDIRILGDHNFVSKAYQSSGCIQEVLTGVTFEEVANFVSQQYQLSLSLLRGGSRARAASEPRAVVAWLCQELNIMSLSEVSRRFGKEGGSINRKIRGLLINKQNQLQEIKQAFNKSKSQA